MLLPCDRFAFPRHPETDILKTQAVSFGPANERPAATTEFGQARCRHCVIQVLHSGEASQAVPVGLQFEETKGPAKQVSTRLGVPVCVCVCWIQ